MSKPTPSEVWFGHMSDAEIAAAAKQFQQDAAAMRRKVAEADAHAGRLRRELRRRKRAAKAGG